MVKFNARHSSAVQTKTAQCAFCCPETLTQIMSSAKPAVHTYHQKCKIISTWQSPPQHSWNSKGKIFLNNSLQKKKSILVIHTHTVHPLTHSATHIHMTAEKPT